MCLVFILRHFRGFAFIRNRERPSAIRRAWARALTAFTVRPRSSAMSKTEALEMISFRSRFSSSEVQAFVLLGLFRMIFSGVMLVFRDLDPRMPEGLVSVLRRKGKDLRNKRRSIRLPS